MLKLLPVLQLLETAALMVLMTLRGAHGPEGSPGPLHLPSLGEDKEGGAVGLLGQRGGQSG
jgi:hypothetical protein